MKRRLIKRKISKNQLNDVKNDIKRLQIPPMPDELSNEKTMLDRMGDEFSSQEPIRELFSSKNIRFKTQLTEEQRSAVAILYHAYRLCEKYSIKFDGLKFVLDEYIDFGVSVDRKSRDEFVKSTQQQIQNQAIAQQAQMQQARNLRL